MKTYEARTFGNVFVLEGGARRILDPRLNLRNHSPTGLSWGFAGSGCAQLALAILCDVYGDEKALRYYQQFNVEMIMTRDRDRPFEMTLAEVLGTVEYLESTA